MTYLSAQDYDLNEHLVLVKEYMDDYHTFQYVIPNSAYGRIVANFICAQLKGAVSRQDEDSIITMTIRGHGEAAE